MPSESDVSHIKTILDYLINYKSLDDYLIEASNNLRDLSSDIRECYLAIYKAHYTRVLSIYRSNSFRSKLRNLNNSMSPTSKVSDKDRYLMLADISNIVFAKFDIVYLEHPLLILSESMALQNKDHGYYTTISYESGNPILRIIRSCLLIAECEISEDTSIVTVTQPVSIYRVLPGVTCLNLDYLTLRGMEQLTKLDFSNCGLISMSISQDAFTDLVNLSDVMFSDCGLVRFNHVNIQSCNKISSIKISGNKLVHYTKISPKSLMYLDLSNNLFENPIDYYMGLSSLSNLNLSKNMLSRLPSKIIYNCYNLKVLDLSFNCIEYIHLLPHSLVNLTDLNLSHNKLKKINLYMFHCTKNLRTLNLSNNMIYSVECRIKTNFRVTDCIDLSFNKIKYLDVRIIDKFSKTTRQVNIDNNPITYNDWFRMFNWDCRWKIRSLIIFGIVINPKKYMSISRNVNKYLEEQRELQVFN